MNIDLRESVGLKVTGESVGWSVGAFEGAWVTGAGVGFSVAIVEEKRRNRC